MISLITGLGIFLGLASAFLLVILHRRQLHRAEREGGARGGLILTGAGADQGSKAAEPMSPPAPPKEKAQPGARKNRKAAPDAEDGPTTPNPSAKSLADILQAPTGLQGTLAQVPVQDFLQFLAQGKRSGVLNVVSGRRHGYVKFFEGRIAHCSFRGLYGLNALQAMLLLQEGDFEFFEGAEAHVPPQAEGGEPHPPLDVVETLLQFDARNRAGLKLASENGET